MKTFSSTFFTLWLLFASTTTMAQKAVADSIPYKVGKYDIKKQEKVFVTAERLGVNPDIIIKLNKLRNVNQELVVGQRIKVPVYPKGYKYEVEKVVIHKEAQLDSAKMALLYADDPTEFNSPIPGQFFDPDEDKTRLLMIDASLELNEAMMQGLQASFDTLNVEDDAVMDEKNISAMLRKMKRSRDKVLLTPYLENIRDSLTHEIVVLKQEKQAIETRLNPPAPPVVKEDTVVSGGDTIVYATKIYADNRPAEKTIAAVIVKDDVAFKTTTTKVELKKNEKKNKKYNDRANREKKNTEHFTRDTIIIYDLPSTNKPLKPAPERNSHRFTQTTAHLDTTSLNEVLKPKIGQWDTARAIDPLKPKGHFWDTAHAVNPVDTKKQLKKDTVASIKVKIPNTNDSIVIKPIVKQKPIVEAKPKKDTIAVVQKTLDKEIEKPKQIETNVVKDTIHVLQEITPVAVLAEGKKSTQKDTTVIVKNKPVEKEVVAKNKEKEVEKKQEAKKETARLSTLEVAESIDSVKKIKAEFFFKRSQKAMREKNFHNVEEYLKKSIELYPKYFDAWFALAEMDDFFGSQQQALKEYATCISIDSTKPQLYLNLGNLYTKMKRKSDAYNSFNRAIDLDPKNITALMARAAILYDWRKYNEAIADYDHVVQIDRSYHFAYKARGQVLLLNRNFKAAIDDFTRFLIFEETDPSAYYYRGLAKLGNNELLDGCLDLSTSASMGYTAAEKAIKKSCQ